MRRPPLRSRDWRGAALALGCVVSLALAGPGAAQQTNQDPAAGPEAQQPSPVRIVPPTAAGEPSPRQRPVAQPERGDITVNLDTVQGLHVAAGTPLWIVDPTQDRITACTLQRTAGTPRIICATRSLP